MLIFVITLGVLEGATVCLTSVVLIDLIGIDKFANAFGILALFGGFASVIGPPLIGLTVQKGPHPYDLGMWITAFIIIVSGILNSFLPCFQHNNGDSDLKSTIKPTGTDNKIKDI